MIAEDKPSYRVREIVVHVARVMLLAAIIWLIRAQHREFLAAELSSERPPPPVERLQTYFRAATALRPASHDPEVWEVFDKDNNVLGSALQTSPRGDAVVGFSGPTNVLVVFDPRGRIVGLEVLSSRDTPEHVALITNDRKFLKSLNGRTAEDVVATGKVDAVSGATLTSLAMIESIQRRLGGNPASLKFPEAIQVKDVEPIFPGAASVVPDDSDRQVIHVRDANGQAIGWALRTSPTADGVIGYQGPTDALVGFDVRGVVVGVALAKSYDNDPYVRYVREDELFRSVFNDKTLAEIAQLDLKAAGIEGVSGATMTSMAVADGFVRAAAAHRSRRDAPPPRPWWSQATLADVGAAVVILGGLVIGFTDLRGRAGVRIAFQVIVFAYLGLVNGMLLSQAQFVGWAQTGVPRAAWGLVLLTLAATLAPIVTRRNLYCSHLCPHGALQQLTLRYARPSRTLSPRFRAVFGFVPAALLAVCLIVAMTHAPFSLVNVEPFDAYVLQVAGGATLVIAVFGVIASMFVPMAYCRYGCPTGSLLEFLRRNARSGELGLRDGFAFGCLIVALAIWWLP